ncbi:MAG: methyltransferase domain-containing protein [Proteobacteria bacterium]|nr:methyltransferase domain-containing protein [Pseudomonadota bacterium]
MSSIETFREIALPGSLRRAPAKVGEIARFFETFRGDETHPRWHSDWAWDNYDKIIPALSRHFGLKRLCEIGGGRDPLFQRQEANALGLHYTINDIDPVELAHAPEGYDKACFDIAGDLWALPGQPGPYDLMVSRMVFEHVADVERAWNNVQALLAPGGVALCFFPTLYAWPFVINHLIPESLSHKIVHALFPNRRDGGGDPKFPAVYDWCYGRESVLRPMLEKAGFSDIHVQPFWGQHYLAKFPVLRDVDAALDRLMARLDWRLFTSYTYVIVRK